MKERFEEILSRVQFPNLVFKVGETTQGELFLQIIYDEEDVDTGKVSEQKGRKWLLSEHMTTSEIVQTAFKAVMTSMEHRTREWFTYRGARVFCPHFDVEALAAVASEKKFDVREET